jgi:alkylmercury lyase
MTTPSIAELRATWTIRPVFSNAEVNRATIQLLADGRPVTAEALAAATGETVAHITAYIEAAAGHGYEVEDGALVGAALTLRPTQHRFRVRGHDLYTWCGFDALFLPIMLGERAEVASTCPVTGTDIKLTVEPDGSVSAASPESAVVGIVGQDVTSCCTTTGPRSDICTQMPLFASRQAGEQWQAGHPGVAIVDLDDARKIARAYVAAC